MALEDRGKDLRKTSNLTEVKGYQWKIQGRILKSFF